MSDISITPEFTLLSYYIPKYLNKKQNTEKHAVTKH